MKAMQQKTRTTHNPEMTQFDNNVQISIFAISNTNDRISFDYFDLDDKIIKISNQ